MANREAKKIERTLKDFSLEVSTSGGGGAIVVNELPTIGKPHTIYELHEDKPADYPWLLTELSSDYPNVTKPFMVVENEENVNQSFLVMPDDFNNNLIVYVRKSNKVYKCGMDPELGFWKQEILPYQNSPIYVIGSYEEEVVFLKDFDYHANSIVEPIVLDGTGHLIDGTVFNYSDWDDPHIVPLVLTDGSDLIYYLEFGVGVYTLKEMQKLPTAKEAVDNKIVDNDGYVVPSPIVNSKAYANNNTGDNYYWDSGQHKFGVYQHQEEAPFEEYTGELEWNDEGTLIINTKITSILANNGGFFGPKLAHIEISYWIYNNKWLNLEDAIDPFLKIGSKFRVKLKNHQYTIGSGTYQENNLGARLMDYNTEDFPNAFLAFSHDYNASIQLTIIKNEANTQLIASISAPEDYYWKLEQPIVIYEGDVSSLNTTDSIMEELPEEVVFTLNENNFVSGMGWDPYNNKIAIGYTSDGVPDIIVEP